MARSFTGILGAFSGRIGPVVGCVRGDVFYIRSRPRKTTVAPTEKLLASRAAFKLAHGWLGPVKDVVRSGFKGYGSKHGGLPAFVGYTLKHALGGAYPNQYIDVARVKLSGGDLQGAETAAVSRGANGEIRFSWLYNPQDETNPFDQAMPVAYNISRGEAVFKTTGNFRHLGMDTLQAPPSWAGEPIHFWLCFVSASREQQSNSQYLGKR